MSSIFRSWLGINDIERQILANENVHRNVHSNLKYQVDQLKKEHILEWEEKYKDYRGTKGTKMSDCVVDEIWYQQEYYKMDKSKADTYMIFDAWKACINRKANTPIVRDWPPILTL